MNIETIALAIAFASVLATGALVVYVMRRPKPVVEPESRVDVGLKLDQVTRSMATEQGALAERFAQLDRMVATLQTSVDKREGAIDEQMGRIGTEVASIAKLFNNDRVRGNWGELSLARIFEVAGLVEGRDYRNQVTDASDTRPDVIVSLPGDHTIVIDSKFPTARYQEAMATEDRDARQAALLAHGKELENVGKSLVKKHYADQASAGYVIVYVPSQAVYETACEAHPEIVDRLMAQNVILAGPVSVFSLIKTAGTLLAEHRALDDAREIVSQVKDLRKRLGVFTDHFQRVGNGLTTATKSFNAAIGSWNSRLAPQVNRIAEMSGADQLAMLSDVHESAVATDTVQLKEIA